MFGLATGTSNPCCHFFSRGMTGWVSSVATITTISSVLRAKPSTFCTNAFLALRITLLRSATVLPDAMVKPSLFGQSSQLTSRCTTLRHVARTQPILYQHHRPSSASHANLWCFHAYRLVFQLSTSTRKFGSFLHILPISKFQFFFQLFPQGWSFPTPSHECMVHVYCNDRSQPTMLEAEKYTRTASCRQGKQHASTHCETGDTTKVEGSSPNPKNAFRGFYHVVTINGSQHGTQIIVNDWCATFWQTDIQWIVSWHWVSF